MYSVCSLLDKRTGPFDKTFGQRAVCREGRGEGMAWPILVGYVNFLLTKA
jgi:hypothetical protein